MKHSFILLSVISLGLLFGCADEKKTETIAKPPITTDTLDFKATTSLYEGSGAAFEMTMKIEWPTEAPDGRMLKKMQREITGMLFGDDLATTDIEFAMDAYDRQSGKLYRQICETEEAAPEEERYMDNWTEYIEGSFCKPYNDMISYTRYISGYSGGVHGMDALSCITFDLKTGELVSGDDLFIENHQDRLVKALRKNLMSSVNEPEMIIEKEIFPSENFYLTEKGITYIYQRYEIGPYYLGIIKVTIPWKEIKDILKQ